MKNITLTVTKQEYDSKIQVEREYIVKDVDYGGFEHDNMLNRVSLSRFDAVDSALLEVLKRASHGNYEVNVTIEGAKLSESLQSFLTDKYEVESEINSVKFA